MSPHGPDHQLEHGEHGHAVESGERPHDHGHHDHHHHGPGGHVHAPAIFGTAFAIGIGLNAAFVIAEAAFGLLSNSVALLADAGHNLSDVLGLLIAWAATVLSRRPPSDRYTYGFRGSSIVAALVNALILLLAIAGIVWEAVDGLLYPKPIATTPVIVVAAIGIAINGITAWLFASGRKDDINIRGAFLHMLADAMISAGVVATGLAIVATGWVWLDPAVSLVIAIVILWGTWGLLRESLSMSVAGVPPGIVPETVRRFLAERPGVETLHDLHIWPMSTTETALTAHLVMPAGHPGDAFLLATARGLKERFAIGHVTLQIETSRDTRCILAPDHVV